MPFPYQTITASRIQNFGDYSSNTRFDNSSGDLTYTLAPIGSLPISNGWMQFLAITRPPNTNKVLIVPSGGDLINTVYNALNPLVLTENRTGGWLTCDGSQWFFQGISAWNSTDSLAPLPHIFHMNAVTDLSLPVLMPNSDLVCTVANNGYAVGDVIFLTASKASLNIGEGFFRMFNSEIPGVDISFGVSIILLNKTTGTAFSADPTQWNLVNREMFRQF